MDQPDFKIAKLSLSKPGSPFQLGLGAWGFWGNVWLGGLSKKLNWGLGKSPAGPISLHFTPHTRVTLPYSLSLSFFKNVELELFQPALPARHFPTGNHCFWIAFTPIKRSQSITNGRITFSYPSSSSRAASPNRPSPAGR